MCNSPKNPLEIKTKIVAAIESEERGAGGLFNVVLSSFTYLGVSIDTFKEKICWSYYRWRIGQHWAAVRSFGHDWNNTWVDHC